MVHPHGCKILRSQLSNSVKRNIKHKEKLLCKKCMSVWAFTNRLNEHFIFARFGKLKEDNTIATLAAYSKTIHRYLTI